MKHDEFIDREQVINALKELTANGTNKGMVFGEDAVHRIEMLPSAQPEIIRCKDCKYNTYSKKCLQPDSFFLVPADDFYCGYAERRTDG